MLFVLLCFVLFALFDMVCWFGWVLMFALGLLFDWCFDLVDLWVWSRLSLMMWVIVVFCDFWVEVFYLFLIVLWGLFGLCLMFAGFVAGCL